MAFCEKCGKKNNDGAIYCQKCGVKLKNTSNISRSKTDPDTWAKNKNIRMVISVVVVVLVVILVIFLFGGRSYKSTIEQFIDNQFKGNVKELFELIPDEVVDYMKDEEDLDRDDWNDALDELEEELEEQMESLDDAFGKNWEISHKILAVEKMKDDDLDDIQDSYEDMDIKISAAKIVEVELLISADETENTTIMDFYLIKVGRSWYIDIANMGSLF